jgi:predicted secreted protein
MFRKLIALSALALAGLVNGIDVTLDIRGHPEKEYTFPVQVDVGSYFYVMLDENPTTGYHWEVVDSNLH